MNALLQPSSAEEWSDSGGTAGPRISMELGDDTVTADEIEFIRQRQASTELQPQQGKGPRFPSGEGVEEGEKLSPRSGTGSVTSSSISFPPSPLAVEETGEEENGYFVRTIPVETYAYSGSVGGDAPCKEEQSLKIPDTLETETGTVSPSRRVDDEKELHTDEENQMVKLLQEYDLPTLVEGKRERKKFLKLHI